MRLLTFKSQKTGLFICAYLAYLHTYVYCTFLIGEYDSFHAYSMIVLQSIVIISKCIWINCYSGFDDIVWLLFSYEIRIFKRCQVQTFQGLKLWRSKKNNSCIIIILQIKRIFISHDSCIMFEIFLFIDDIHDILSAIYCDYWGQIP